MRRGLYRRVGGTQFPDGSVPRPKDRSSTRMGDMGGRGTSRRIRGPRSQDRYRMVGHEPTYSPRGNAASGRHDPRRRKS